jgi:hypothetical protein
MSELLDTWIKLKRQLEQTDSAVMDRLVNAYGLSYEKITPEIESLVELIQAQLDAGKLTKASVSKSAAYKKLIASVKSELDDYSVWLKTEVKTASTDAAKQGLSAGKFLLLVGLAGSLGVAVNEVPREIINNAPPDALSFLADYLNPDGVLYGKINGMSKYRADEIAAGILDLVSQGKNPRVIARFITDNYGISLTDSLRQIRTSQLYSYRQANLTTMQSNAGLLEGWVWDAELDDVCCPVCVSMHGTVHPLDETMDSHYNCRCAPIPWVKGMNNPVEQSGEDWLNSQDEQTKKEVLGSKYDGWSNGDFKLSDIIGTYQSDVYGNMLIEKPLKDLIDA